MIYVLKLAVLPVTAIALPIILANNHCASHVEAQKSGKTVPPAFCRANVVPRETHATPYLYLPALLLS